MIMPPMSIAKEVERIFEAKVNPITIYSKARRMQGDSNESPGQPNKNVEIFEDAKSKLANGVAKK